MPGYILCSLEVHDETMPGRMSRSDEISEMQFSTQIDHAHPLHVRKRL